MLKINDLTFSYDGQHDIIKNFSESFEKGERVCIKAPSGRGKTTLLRLICGLEKTEKGKIIFSQEYKIGMVFQEDILLPWKTAKENVSVVSDSRTAEKWLTEFELTGSTDKYPSQLSGGMCRRVALARACAFAPDILILDEAFKGIDLELKTKITSFLKSEFSSKLIIFTSHDEGEIELFATRTVFL